MDKPINQRFVMLSSRIPFPDDIETGDDVSVSIKGRSFIANCVKREFEDQQDGTENVVYKLKFVAE